MQTKLTHLTGYSLTRTKMAWTEWFHLEVDTGNTLKTMISCSKAYADSNVCNMDFRLFLIKLGDE